MLWVEALGDTCPAPHPGPAGALRSSHGGGCCVSRSVSASPRKGSARGSVVEESRALQTGAWVQIPTLPTVRLGDPASAPRPESPLPHLKKCVRSFLPCRQGQRAGTQVPGTHRTLDVPFPSSFSKPEASSGSLEEGALETAITGGRWAKASLLNSCAQLYVGHGTRRSDPSTELPAPPPRVLRLMESYSTDT